MSVNSVLLVWWFQSLVKHGLYWTIFWTVTRSGQTWFFALPPLSLQACLDQLRWATWTWPPLWATQPLQLPPAAQRVLYVFLKFSVDLQHKFSTQFLHHRLFYTAKLCMEMYEKWNLALSYAWTINWWSEHSGHPAVSSSGRVELFY